MNGNFVPAVSMNVKALVDLDLNLLVAFLMIFRERSVGRAATYLDVKQPAVSNSLVRLRQYLNDPFFIRSGREMCPTAKARRIAALLVPAMQQIENAITR